MVFVRMPGLRVSLQLMCTGRVSILPPPTRKCHDWVLLLLLLYPCEQAIRASVLAMETVVAKLEAEVRELKVHKEARKSRTGWWPLGGGTGVDSSPTTQSSAPAEAKTLPLDDIVAGAKRQPSPPSSPAAADAGKVAPAAVQPQTADAQASEDATGLAAGAAPSRDALSVLTSLPLASVSHRLWEGWSSSSSSS